ncbi:aminotransferase class I/II-fold pyridoxal phosphate-dependent enzyme [Oceanobacillus halotolerans]|uniref:aminotransferase class I/II-fold pyridoxal phosphate-dependent enzyme n=1 Tax=Oceanobacillus halotolerans TaxID=2663380 RepID=UPI0013D2455F|nr:aminotransferase class I/II-fold pyridoxal phosphate-dependent enzyme [Oceanobacillus halotolerans]
MNQEKMPLFEKMNQFQQQQPISFHVPGHKNGNILPSAAKQMYENILSLDVTELPGLDDLHAPQGVIAEAESLAASYFRTDHTFFLVNGTTAGNLAMILATCQANDKVIVQRNSHKSIMHGLELSGARPIFISPIFDKAVDRYTTPSVETIEQALKVHPDAKAVLLTYPDYYGETYNLGDMIQVAHSYQIPVLVDEAHGVHFSISDLFPPSSIELGADIVVQSAHKMAPAMTMGSFLHVNSTLVSQERVAYYLQMIQSSSPSYPIMASLDIARAYLATRTKEDLDYVMDSVTRVKNIFQKSQHWKVIHSADPLKLTLHIKDGVSCEDAAHFFEQEGIHPELVTHNQILFIHGLAPFDKVKQLENAVKSVNDQLKNRLDHDTIELSNLFIKPMQELALSYHTINKHEIVQKSFYEAIGDIAAEAVIPYPPGIPIILKGEVITHEQIGFLEQLIDKGITIQHRDINNGLRVLK